MEKITPVNEPEKNLRQTEFLVKVLYTTQALTAVAWVVAAVFTGIAFVSKNGNPHPDILVMCVLAFLLIIQQFTLGKAIPLRNEWRKRVNTHDRV